MTSFVPSDILAADQHILSPTLFPGSSIGYVQTLTRAWHFSLEDGSAGRRNNPHKILLRHCQATGDWVLIIDGKFILSGGEPVLNRTFAISFQFGGKDVTIHADGQNTFYYEHLLIIDGIQYDDIRKTVDLQMNENLPKSVAISNYRTYTHMSKMVVVYIITLRTGIGSELTIERRYSDFAQLDVCIRSATEGHMYSSLPEIPGKCYNPWTDQNSDEFISERKRGLEQYLRMLLGNSKCKYYTDLLVFLGLDPITAQIDETPTMYGRYDR